jgi:HPr kinase/phosphorylase
VIINLHATSLVFAGMGLMIEGPSGSGKSRLALDLIEHAHQTHNPAILIADDQTFVEVENGCLIAVCPPSIAGLIEQRGVGIITLPHQKQAKIDLVIKLIAAEDTVGLQHTNRTITICGVERPLVFAPARQPDQALKVVLAEVSKFSAKPDLLFA